VSFLREKCRNSLKLRTIVSTPVGLHRSGLFERIPRIRLNRLCAIAFFLSVVTLSALSQTCQVTQLRVHVKDSQESPIYDVQVHAQTGAMRPLEKATGTGGTADFDNIPCGTYAVTANKQGFAEKSATAETGKARSRS
jgi:hypothetical protein